jgi:alkylation response protein AidB-like acyl-CoA dehydrogenase
MDFSFTEEQELLRSTVREFLEAYCTREWVEELEEKGEYPFDLHEKLAELGLFGLIVPEEYGGTGSGMIEAALVSEELGRISGSVVQTWHPSSVFAGYALMAASPEIRQRFLPPLAEGKLKLSFSLTEPEAGSDAASVRTRAVPDGDHWVLNGNKIFSTAADIADYLVLTARTGTAEERHRGLTVFLVDTKLPGISMSRIKKIGHHAVQSPEVGLDSVRVPADMIIGDVNGGWRALIDVMDAERIGVAALCVGLAQKCIDLALDYGLQRKQFGQPVATFQALSHMLAEMETETTAARWLAYYSAWLKDEGLPCSKAASMAKVYGTEVASRTASRALQIHGGYGYTVEYEVSRHFKEAKLYEVAGGSTQIQRNIIAREMGVRG